MVLGKSRKVIKNSIYNNIGYFWQLLISLLLTPFVIHKLGVEKFGIWVLLEVIVAFFCLLDFTGIGDAFVKYISEYHTKKDFKNLNHVINLGWAYYTFFWIIIVFFVFVFKRVILNLFNFSQDLYSTVSVVFIGILLISFIRGSFAVFRSVLLGLQRMDITNIIAMLTSLVNAAAIILFLNLGYGLKGLVASGLIVAVLTIFLQTFFAFKVFPQMKFNPFSFNKSIFKKTFVFGVNMRITGISELVNMHVDKIFLGYFLNTSLVGFYELGAKIAKIVRSFPEQLLPAILPASSELHAQNDKKNLQKLYYRGSKYLCLLTFPLTFLIISNASLIMTFWMGKPGYNNSALALQILSIGYVFMLLVSIGRLVARGMGIPQYEMRSSVLITIVNIMLSCILIIKLGFFGALLGTSISGTLGSLYFIFLFHRRINESLFSILKKIYANPFLFCIISLMGSLFVKYIFEMIFQTPATNRLGAFYYIVINGSIFLGVYLFFIFKSHYIDKYDREIFSGFIGLIKSTLKRRNNN